MVGDPKILHKNGFKLKIEGMEGDGQTIYYSEEDRKEIWIKGQKKLPEVSGGGEGGSGCDNNLIIIDENFVCDAKNGKDSPGLGAGVIGPEALMVNRLISGDSVLEKNASRSNEPSDEKIPVKGHALDVDDYSGCGSSQRFALFGTPTFISKIEPEIENTPDSDRMDSPMGPKGDIDFGNFGMKVQSCEEFLPEVNLNQNRIESPMTDTISPAETIRNLKLGVLSITNSQCSHSEIPIGLSTHNEQSNNISFLTQKEKVSVKRIKVQLPGPCTVHRTESVKRLGSPYERGLFLLESRNPDEGDMAMNLESMA